MVACSVETHPEGRDSGMCKAPQSDSLRTCKVDNRHINKTLYHSGINNRLMDSCLEVVRILWLYVLCFG